MKRKLDTWLLGVRAKEATVTGIPTDAHQRRRGDGSGCQLCVTDSVASFARSPTRPGRPLSPGSIRENL